MAKWEETFISPLKFTSQTTIPQWRLSRSTNKQIWKIHASEGGHPEMSRGGGMGERTGTVAADRVWCPLQVQQAQQRWRSWAAALTLWPGMWEGQKQSSPGKRQPPSPIPIAADPGKALKYMVPITIAGRWGEPQDHDVDALVPHTSRAW